MEEGATNGTVDSNDDIKLCNYWFPVHMSLSKWEVFLSFRLYCIYENISF